MKTEEKKLQEIESAASSHCPPHPVPDEYWYPNSAVRELQRNAYVLGATEWMQNHQHPPQMTEEQMEQEAKTFAANNCDGSTSYASMYTAYLACLKAHAAPATVEDGWIKDLALSLINTQVLQGGLYLHDVMTIIRQHLSPKP